MVSATVILKGHIIDSLTLPKVLDRITSLGGEFEIVDIRIGQRRQDASEAKIRIAASSNETMENILWSIRDQGAIPVEENREIRLMEVELDGTFPDRFYATTNLPTCVRLGGRWIPVENPEMDCGIRVEREKLAATTVPMHMAKKGNLIVVGSEGIRVEPLEREIPPRTFEFMSNPVSSEKPKGLLIREIAHELARVKNDGGKVLVVAGPGLVHTGAASHLVEMIERGYVHVLFGGNGLAVHDIESAIYGTSLGVHLEKSLRTSEGHEHHLWAINTIRKAGGIRAAVERGILTKGIFYSCIKNGVDFVLAGSIRDDGPLPDVVADVIKAQDLMRKKVRGIGLALMMATTLHAIATGNLLPASVRTICVDINPAVVTKLSDRGTFQSLGVVTDVEPFLRELCQYLL